MSYNITNWKTKKLVKLNMPIDPLYARDGWKASRPVLQEDGRVVVNLCESGEIIGTLKKKHIEVDEISLCGEGSGTMWREMLKPALEQSTGRLEVLRVWEGGDCVDMLRVVDGVITEAEME